MQGSATQKQSLSVGYTLLKGGSITLKQQIYVVEKKPSIDLWNLRDNRLRPIK